jgi:hypothetical protein
LQVQQLAALQPGLHDGLVFNLDLAHLDLAVLVELLDVVRAHPVTIRHQSVWLPAGFPRIFCVVDGAAVLPELPFDAPAGAQRQLDELRRLFVLRTSDSFLKPGARMMVPAARARQLATLVQLRDREPLRLFQQAGGGGYVAKHAHTLDSSVTFDAETHVYYVSGQAVPVSVTAAIGRLFPPFAADVQLDRIAAAGGFQRTADPAAGAMQPRQELASDWAAAATLGTGVCPCYPCLCLVSVPMPVCVCAHACVY